MEAPKIASMFKGLRSRPRGFNFIPRYYDMEKEEFEKRLRQTQKELEIEERERAASLVRMEQSFEGKSGLRHTPIHDQGRTRRLAIIFLGLITILYTFFKYIS